MIRLTSTSLSTSSLGPCLAQELDAVTHADHRLTDHRAFRAHPSAVTTSLEVAQECRVVVRSGPGILAPGISLNKAAKRFYELVIPQYAGPPVFERK
jgi:hypothetical protein